MYVAILVNNGGKKSQSVNVKGPFPDYATAKAWCDDANEGYEKGPSWEAMEVETAK